MGWLFYYWVKLLLFLQHNEGHDSGSDHNNSDDHDGQCVVSGLLGLVGSGGSLGRSLGGGSLSLARLSGLGGLSGLSLGDRVTSDISSQT